MAYLHSHNTQTIDPNDYARLQTSVRGLFTADAQAAQEDDEALRLPCEAALAVMHDIWISTIAPSSAGGTTLNLQNETARGATARYLLNKAFSLPVRDPSGAINPSAWRDEALMKEMTDTILKYEAECRRSIQGDQPVAGSLLDVLDDLKTWYLTQDICWEYI